MATIEDNTDTLVLAAAELPVPYAPTNGTKHSADMAYYQYKVS